MIHMYIDSSAAVTF